MQIVPPALLIVYNSLPPLPTHSDYFHTTLPRHLKLKWPPLPTTHTFLNGIALTIMCASTRFPEAIPLRKITAPVIVKGLIKFFTLVGLPRAVQSDQGTNFMSNIFQQVMFQLGITQYKSSAYHPESQGALERFHQTMKTMMKIYCQEHDKDWDEGIHLLLFAARDPVQESLGFSPFELVFGHSIQCMWSS